MRFIGFHIVSAASFHTPGLAGPRVPHEGTVDVWREPLPTRHHIESLLDSGGDGRNRRPFPPDQRRFQNLSAFDEAVDP